MKVHNFMNSKENGGTQAVEGGLLAAAAVTTSAAVARSGAVGVRAAPSAVTLTATALALALLLLLQRCLEGRHVDAGAAGRRR